MQDRTPKGSGRKSAALTNEDVFGMFEAGLQELAAHFVFDAANAPGGVRLTISGLERIDHADGTWSLRIIPAASNEAR